MKFRFTIARRLWAAFGILLFAVLFTSSLTYRTLQENLKSNRDISEKITPAKNDLNSLYLNVAQSKYLIQYWVFIDQQPGSDDKKLLVSIQDSVIPLLESRLMDLSKYWEPDIQVEFNHIVNQIDSLVDREKSLQNTLHDFSSYQDYYIILQAKSDADDLRPVADKIVNRIKVLAEKQTGIEKKENAKIKTSFAQFQRLVIILGIILVVALLLIGFLTTRTLVAPINYIKEVIANLGLGILPMDKLKERNDEIGDMSKALNNYINSLRQISDFATEIGRGKLDVMFKPLSDNDELGNSLLLMRENLQQAQNEEERRKETDREFAWATNGVAIFSEILRQNSDNLTQLASAIINKIVDYTNANIGGIFIKNDDNPKDVFLELMAFNAYNRERYMEKRIEIGVSLVGQAVKEGETVFMTDLPKDYIYVKSGLGQDIPRSLVIVPLKVDEDVLGAIELASINVLEKYKIEFIERISESIASTIARVKINEKTSQLLAETQKNSDEMVQKEQEMLKRIKKIKEEYENLHQSDIEETQQTKQKYEQQLASLNTNSMKEIQELNDKIKLLGLQFEAIETSTPVIEYETDGIIKAANVRFLRIAEINMETIENKNHKDFLSTNVVRTVEYQALWSNLQKGISVTNLREFTFSDKPKWFYEILLPISSNDGTVYKIIGLLINATELKNKEKELKEKIQQANIEIQRLKSLK